MRKRNIIISALLLLITVPLLAQDQQVPANTPPPPPPLQDTFLKWMVGEWQGTTTSPNGKSMDYMKCEMDLGGQFLRMTYKAVAGDKVLFSGMGMSTLDKDGKPAGYWMDSWRTMSEGHGTQTGNINTMKWTMAEGPYVRTTEKIDENTMHVTSVMTGPDGKEMKAETELKRIK